MNRKALTDDEKKEYLLYADNEKTLKVVAYEVIGRGANAIAYRGMVDGKCCVIKEAFPEVSYGSVCYLREEYGKEVRLVVKEEMSQEEKEQLIEQEKERIYRSVKRECDVVGKMFYDGENNSPYVYSAKTLREYGKEEDYLYAILDTREGRTLRNIIKENDGRLTFDEAIGYFKKILEVIRTLLKDQYCHADIKPDNIWIQGKNDNQSVVFIDLGSAFGYSEFKISEAASDEDYVECAKKVQLFPGIGSSSEGYQSKKMKALGVVKDELLIATFKNRKVVEKSKEFVKIINQISAMDDLYSAIQTLFVMLTGKLYIRDGKISIKSISDEIGLEKLVVEYLLQIMKRNEEGYKNLEEIEKDIEILCKIYKKGPHPEVLIDKLKKNIRIEQKIEKGLLAEVE